MKHMEPKIDHEQYNLKLKCPHEIRKYFPKSLFEGEIILETKEYVGREFKTLWIYYIRSKNEGKGNVQRAIKKLFNDGYDVRIVLPGDPMKHIAEKFGMVKKEEKIMNYNGETEYWMRPERCASGYTDPCDSDCAWCEKNRGCKFKLFLEEYAYVI